MANESARNDGPILALNSGSSSLKFGIYQPGRTDEEPLLTGSADGIGRGNGTLRIRASDGKPLLQRDCVHESQSDALNTLAAVIREHIDTAPVALGHRVVHGGPNLLRHQIITPKVLDQLRSATHFAPLHIPQALSLIAAAQSIFPVGRTIRLLRRCFSPDDPRSRFAFSAAAALFRRRRPPLWFPRHFLRIAGASFRRKASQTSHLRTSG